MKKILNKIISILIIIAAASCSSKEIEFFEMRVDKSHLTTYAEGGNAKVKINAPEKVKAVTDQDWMTTNVVETSPTVYEINIKIQPNKEKETREGLITVTSGKQSKTIKISQKGITVKEEKPQDVYEELEIQAPDSDIYGFEGETISFEIPIKADPNETIRAEIQSSMFADATILINDNESAEVSFVMQNKKGYIMILISDSKMKKSLTVNTIPYYASSEENKLTAEWKGGNFTLPFSTNMSKTEFELSADKDWVNASLENDGTVKIEIKENDSSKRTATISVCGRDGLMNIPLWTVTQKEANPVIDGCVWFQDPEMKHAIKRYHDYDSDGQISYEEAAAVKTLDLSDLKLESFTGIEHFVSLEEIDVSGNNATTLDLSGNHANLKKITIDNVKQLDITGCRILMTLTVPGSDQFNGTVTALENHYIKGTKCYKINRVADDNVSTDFSHDGETVTLQEHSEGSGIPVQIMIEGMLDTDIETGVYDQIAREACNALFEIEPSKTFSQRFDVEYVIKTSKQRVDLDDETRETAFEVKRKEKNEPVKYNLEASDDKLEIVILFSNDYGRSHATNKNIGNAICWYSKESAEQFMLIIQHEVIGHVIAELNDEYNEARTLIQGGNIKTYHKNCTQYTKLSEQEDCWQELASYKEYYDELTTLYRVFEDENIEYYHTSANSIMNNHYATGGDKFNAISRYFIWEALHKHTGYELGDIKTRIKSFVEYDKINIQ